MFELINDFGRQWALYFGFATLQNTLFLAMVFLALLILSKANARLKYFITLIGLLKLLLPPVFPFSLTSTLPQLSPLMEAVSASATSETGRVGIMGLSKGLALFGAAFIMWGSIALIGLIVPLLATALLKARLA